MGAKKRRKLKGGQAAADPAAAALEGVQKLSTQYEGAAEAEKLLPVSVGGKVGADKNGVDRVILGSGRSCSVIV